MKLKNKVALITGGAIGIGRAEACLFAAEGAKIAVADINDAGGNETAAQIIKNGGEAVYFHTDVTQADQVEKLVNEVIKKYKRIDILVNDVGIPQELHTIEETDEELWDKVHDVNLKSVFLVTKQVVPYMKKQGSGVIINTSTMNAVKPHSLHCALASAKSAVITLTRAFARELAEYNIRVNCISPWTIDTPSFRNSLTPEQQNAWISEIPLKRLGRPEDIAYAALYLVSDEASWVTGINLCVDGGYGIT